MRFKGLVCGSKGLGRVVQAGSAADLSGDGPTAMNLRSHVGLGEILMSVQMVLLPVFMLVGLTFFLLLWMATAR
ncbi:MAG TPA: hypothetical protein VFP38_12745, partial [Bradyrhizobium sp.]|nr:hypothetical protein [Bradyrhizobium sp.]